MIAKIVHLKEIYPFLDNDGADPTLEVMLRDQHFGQKVPAVVVLPGGAYKILCPREGEPVALEFMADGANGFVLNYSLNPILYPQQLLEVAAAFDYIRKNADEFSVDPEKIAILGFSAGGHLAASYSTMLFRDEITKHIEPKPANAAILCYPVISAEGNTHFGSFHNLTGTTALTDELAEKHSAEKHVGKHTPPTYIFATSNDNGVPVSNSLKYASALAAAEIPYELHIFPDGRHGISTAKFTSIETDEWEDGNMRYNSQWIEEARIWLKRQFDY